MAKILVNLHACKNIIQGTIVIHPKQINIKYAQNGTGKSTVGDALCFHVKKDLAQLADMQSFLVSDKPQVEIRIEDDEGNITTNDEYFHSVEVFDEEFVRNVVFKENQAILNSFDVFIRSAKYEQSKNAIDDRLKKLHVDIANDPRIKALLDTLKIIVAKIQLNNDGALAKRGIIKDAMNPVSAYHIPEPLRRYEKFFLSPDRVSWVEWKAGGYRFKGSEICPFCAEPLPTQQVELDQRVFETSYSKSVVKNQKELEDLLIELEPYIEPVQFKLLIDYTRNPKNPTDFMALYQNFILEIRHIVDRITALTSYNTFGINGSDLDIIEQQLLAQKITVDVFTYFKSRLTLEIFTLINEKIDLLLSEVSLLKGETAKLNKYIRKVISESCEDINEFLSLAGINYEFRIIAKSDSDSLAQLIYIGADPNDAEQRDIRKCLSWGERNAIALVLFIYYVNAKNADLVILDDPISSFDKSKKFAIVSRLFKKPSEAKSLLKKTVLLLTHDFEPIIDLAIEGKFSNKLANATYLTNVDGVLFEQKVEPNSDIKPITVLYLRDMQNENVPMVCRFASCRKYLEYVIDNYSADPAYHYVTSLLKGRPNPISRKDDPQSILTDRAVTVAKKSLAFVMGISEQELDYNDLIRRYFNREQMIQALNLVQNTYLRILILRAICVMDGAEKEINDRVLRKYLNSCFHIENDYSQYLDYMVFDPVPSFIKKKIDSSLARLPTTSCINLET